MSEGHKHELRVIEQLLRVSIRLLEEIRNRLPSPRAMSLISKITDGGQNLKAKGSAASIHINSTTAQVTFQEFDGPNGSGNPVPPVGPVAFLSDTPATLTVDSNGKITPVAVGTATITTTDTGNSLSDSNFVTVTAALAQSLVASITP
jgi:hypothetical protein